MPLSFYIKQNDTEITENNGPAGIGKATINISGIGSWIAFPFIQKNDNPLNLLAFNYGNVTGAGTTTATSIRVGIGTLDENTGTPILDSNKNLIFIGSTSVNVVNADSQSFQLVALPEINLNKKSKYYFGIITESRLATTTINIVDTLHNTTSLNRGGNYRVSFLTSTGNTTLNSTIDRSPVNYGYYSGIGNSTWYNEKFPGYTTNLQTVGTAGSQFGFTFFMNSDLSAIEISEVQFYCRSQYLLSSGLGNTWSVILYDSDGTTALTASTICYFSTQPTNAKSTVLPINYTLQNKKLYHFAIQGIGASSGNAVYYVDFPYQFQSGNAITSIYFTKDSASSNPVYFENDQLIYGLNVIKTYGSRQGGPGSY